MSLSVRALASEGAASTHLQSGGGVGGVARLHLGTLMHQEWQRSRAKADADFRAEVDLSTQLEVRGWTVKIHGRADGMTRIDGRCCVQEYKSTALAMAAVVGLDEGSWPEYALQLRIYMWMVVRGGEPDPIGELLIQPISEKTPVVVRVEMSVSELDLLIRGWLRRLIVDKERDASWRDTRSAARLRWPFQGYRTGQRQLMRAIDLSLEEQVPILVSAATGFGKSIAALTEALSYAVRTGRSLFWTTGRNSGAAAALDAARLLSESGMPLRVVSIRAKEKMCLNGAVTCHPDLCPYAKNYYVKRNDSDAIALLHQRGVASPEDAMEIGESAQICPHELTLDASRAVDLVVGDMNYLFDPHAMIRRHFPENAKQWVVVVDEAHGLVDRVRRSLSPVISTRELDEALVQCAGDVPWSDLITKLSNFVRRPLLESDRYRDGLALAEMPTLDLGDLLEACEDLSLALPPREGVSVVVAQLRRLVDHLRWREGESEDAFVDVSGERGRVSSLGSLCIDPSGWIAKQMRSFGGCVVLSATLRPERFFVDNFGIRALKPRVFDAGTPFPPENQLVLRMGGISTRYKDREASAGRIAAVISSVIAAVHSGVAVYFSSYAAMDSVVPLVGELNCELLMQRRAMTAEAREAILDRMKSTEGVCALFAVLGGSFAEAVDLPSGVLDAVVVVGPGLPPVGLEQTLLQRHYQQRFSEGFLYASVVPGVSKVVQAAGRLIRRAEDRGAIVLIGERFQEPMFYDQFPSWWVPVDVEDPTVYLSGHFAQEA